MFSAAARRWIGWVGLAALAVALSACSLRDARPARIEEPSDTGLVVVNETDTPICNVFMSPSSAAGWGDDALKGRIKAGEEGVFEIAAGWYNVLVEDCDGHIMTSAPEVRVDGAYTMSIRSGGGPRADLTLVNDAATPICAVHISPAAAVYWGRDWLGGKSTIAPGASHTFSVPQGAHDVRALDCDENVVGSAMAVEVEDAATVDLP